MTLKPAMYLLSLHFGVVLACAQTTTNTTAPSNKLAFLVQDLLSNTLQTISDPGLRTSIDQAIRPRFASINTGVATALSNLPIPTSASGLRFFYNDPVGGWVPVEQSLGPILTERAETVEKNKLYIALTYQRFQFDRLDAVDFRNFEVGIPVQVPLAPTVALNGLLLADTNISLHISQVTAHVTYGLTHNIDVSMALPLVTSSMTVSTEGTFRVISSAPTSVSFPRTGLSLSSTGVGDVLGRVKVRVLSRPKGAAVALVTDVRLPTGDEFNYHGAGAFGVKPFIAVSFIKGSISPHLNAGYQWNGESFLATPLAREKGRLPGQIFASVGAEAAISRRFTAAFDLLDQAVIHGSRSVLHQDTAIDGTPYNTFSFVNQTHHETNASIGFKAKFIGDAVLSCNLLFRLNKDGLRSRVVPFVGLSHIF